MNIFVLVAAAAMALVSCNKQEVEAPKPQEVEYEYTFEIAGDTKATIGNDCVVWESGDQIGVYTDGQNGVSYNRWGDITLGTPVTFKVSSYYALVAGDMVHCYYPYVSSNSQDPRTVNLSIPTSQTEKNQMPMVSLPYAVTENLAEKTDSEKSAGEIRFANLGSVIEFHVYSTTEAYQTELVKSVTFNADQAIAGDFTFDITAVDYSDEETLAISGYEATKVVSTLSTSTQVSSDKNAATVVKMVVAPGSYAGNVVVTTDKATYTYSISEDKAKNFKRSAVYPIGLNLRADVREENAVEPEPEVETTVTFDFTSSAELTSWGITLPNPGAGTNVTTLAKGQVTMLADGGSTKTRVWNSSGSYDLRVYKGATLTFSVPSGYVINDIVVEGSVTTSISKSTLPNNPVVLTVAAGADTQKISAITVKYAEGEVVATQLSMGNVTCVNATTSTLTFSWEAVNGAKGYKVSLDGGNSYTELFDDTNYTWVNLDPETEYTIYVRAIGNGINTLDSEAVFASGSTTAEQVGVVTMSKKFTFDGSNGQKDFSVTQAPIKIAFAKADGSNAPNDHSQGHIRIYAGNTMTFTGGTIVKIELKYSDASYPGTSTKANVGTLSQDTNSKMWTWVGKATSIILTGGDKQGRYDSITVYYESDGTTPDPIQLEMSEITCSTQTENSLTFTWTAVANATGYEVTCNNKTETVTETEYTATDLTAGTQYEVSIKAVGDGVNYTTSDAGTAEGTTKEAQQPDDTQKYYVKVTSSQSDWSGTYLIIGVTGSKLYAFSSMNAYNSESYGKYSSVSESGTGKILSTSTIDAYQVVIAKSTNGYTIKFGDYYLGKNGTSGNTMQANKSYTAKKYEWKIALNSIQNANATSYYLQWNSNSGQERFSCYKSTQNNVMLYKLED